MPPRFPRACVKCGVLNKNGGSLCPGCEATALARKEANPARRAKKQFLYGGDYTRKAQTVRQTATHCYLCGEPFEPGDKIEADHLFPELGNKSPLGGSHPHCNKQKSNNNIHDMTRTRKNPDRTHTDDHTTTPGHPPDTNRGGSNPRQSGLSNPPD